MFANIIKKKNKAIVSLAALSAIGAIGLNGAVDTTEAFAEDNSTVTIDSSGNLSYTGDLVEKDAGQSWTDLISKYRFFIAGISGIGTVSMILFFVINFTKLGATSGNPQARSSAISGLIFSGLAAAGLGAVTFIVGIFFNAI